MHIVDKQCAYNSGQTQTIHKLLYTCFIFNRLHAEIENKPDLGFIEMVLQRMNIKICVS